ncbi:unnamed protein product [Periconia digitata]|uniref:Uncharacterized protein n=1 Tax=Periconia digitata TaxID=1303443 RepID=A0A9W4XDI0_9PLEO|nr:unnamed protein product [Periconia digitata]
MSSNPGLLAPSSTALNQTPSLSIDRRSSSQSPYDRPYDPHDSPNTDYDAGDISTHHMDEPHHTQMSSPIYKSEYAYQPAGTPTDSDSRSLLTAKPYDHRISRLALIRVGTYRLGVTLAFSFLIGISLKAYTGFEEPYVMNRVQVRIFNALMLGLSLGLGLNLASSLKRYATILRWSLLTRRYVSLEVFDLILNLEALTNVGKLMVISLPGIGPQGRLKFLRKFPWFRDGRDDGTHFTWIVCMLWLLVNVGAQILVASLSLFWPVEPSNTLPLMTYGNVTVANLTSWTDEVAGDGWWPNTTALDAAWTRGMEGSIYPVRGLDQQDGDLAGSPGTPLYRGDGFHQYNFYNRDPERQYQNYVQSSRSVQARASCKQLESGLYLIDDDDIEYLQVKEEGARGWSKFDLPIRQNGSITYSASTYSYCGPRCTNFTVYQDIDSNEIIRSALFFCNTTLSEIKGDSAEFINLSPQDKKILYGTDDFARIATGAIGWTGSTSNGWDDRQSQVYMIGTTFSPNKMVDAKTIEDLLARFTISAIAAFDDHGVRYNLTQQYSRPVQGSVLEVDWAWVLGLLGGICLLQLAALICLLSFGNKSIIRDDSAFSLAMLLSPVVSRIGKEGMNMNGDEIKNHPKLMWKKIKYDYTEGGTGEPNKVDVVFLGRGDWETRRSWKPGLYA